MLSRVLVACTCLAALGCAGSGVEGHRVPLDAPTDVSSSETQVDRDVDDTFVDGVTSPSDVPPDVDDGGDASVGDTSDTSPADDGAVGDTSDASPDTADVGEDTNPPVSPCEGITEGGACDDGDACTTGDRCVAGVCRPLTLVTCDDHNPCTDDVCDPARGCTTSNNLAGCDDGDACTSGDRCVAGTCRAGVAKCDDGNPCTRDSCSAGTCGHIDDDGAPCEDASACTGGDSCMGGVCLAGLGDGCAAAVGSDPCTLATCAADGLTCAFTLQSNVPCDDGNACTVDDTCQQGLCKPGPANSCGWDTKCGTFHCDAVLGCVLEQAFDAGKTCSDNDKCTTGDICDGHGACATSGVLDCDDHNSCTDDTCFDYFGCSHSWRSGPCNDDDRCTTSDQCSGGVCRGTAIVCNDGDPCTSDSCDPLTGCETAARDCDDHNPCTVDACDPLGGCLATPRTGACEDGLACTAGDSCVLGACLGVAVACDDADPCTTDVCDHDGCAHDPRCDALAGEGCVVATEACVAPQGALEIVAVVDERVTLVNRSAASFALDGFRLDDARIDDVVMAPNATLVFCRSDAADCDVVLDTLDVAAGVGVDLATPDGTLVMTFGASDD